MKCKQVFMYSGQGSQYYGMAKRLFMDNAVFRNTILDIDLLMSEITGGRRVLGDLFKANNQNVFDDILYTHPAIFAVECAMTQLLNDQGIYPDVVIGYSMGEFAAGVAAGSWDMEQALKAVIEQAEIINKRCPEGKMLTVLADVNTFERNAYIKEKSELASINYSKHFVISGLRDDIFSICKKLKQSDIMCIDLPVRHAFHSRHIDEAKDEFQKYMKNISLSAPKVEWLSSTYPERREKCNVEDFWQIARNPVYFDKTIKQFIGEKNIDFYDMGSPGTLCSFAKYNLLSDSGNKYHNLLIQH